MSRFWKVRLATLIWGFAVVYLYTGKLDMTSELLLMQVAGNTVIMLYFLKGSGDP